MALVVMLCKLHVHLRKERKTTISILKPSFFLQTKSKQNDGHDSVGAVDIFLRPATIHQSLSWADVNKFIFIFWVADFSTIFRRKPILIFFLYRPQKVDELWPQRVCVRLEKKKKKMNERTNE